MNETNLNYFWAWLMVEELTRLGIRRFCVAPGSRSAPLAMMAADHPRTCLLTHFDERGVAFHALGYAAARREPCAVITTSGTAVANLFPAVVEASKKKLPMILLTADRPPELRLTGAHQTIDQVKFFHQYVRWQMDVPVPTTSIPPAFVLTTIDQAVYQAAGRPGGPVHLNIMFREPLHPAGAAPVKREYRQTLADWESSDAPYTVYHAPRRLCAPGAVEEAARAVCGQRRGVIVTGRLSSDDERAAVLALAERLNWPVFPDISSGLRLGVRHPLVMPYYDQVLAARDKDEALCPEVVLHLGGRITSKRFNQWIRRCRPRRYVMVLNHPLRHDPWAMVHLRVEASVEDFCRRLTDSLPERRDDPRWATDWQETHRRVEDRLNAFFQEAGDISEMTAARTVSELLPEGSGLFLSNSMPLRDMDMYANPRAAAVRMEANRGASGIDGIIASISGFAAGLGAPVTAMVGDLAFWHDLNALAMFRDIETPVVMVVLNNQGGGIFSFLPIRERNPHFERCFGLAHDWSVPAAAECFHLDYVRPETRQEFRRVYRQAVAQSGTTIIEVRSDRQENLSAHRRIITMLQSGKENAHELD